ncbi:hypothetical protein FRB99_005649 [Tulasnella sp. 403]|nr:hypothetical protein FRB99_005649 [Tulasnella sp. 403]
MNLRTLLALFSLTLSVAPSCGSPIDLSEIAIIRETYVESSLHVRQTLDRRGVVKDWNSDNLFHDDAKEGIQNDLAKQLDDLTWDNAAYPRYWAKTVNDASNALMAHDAKYRRQQRDTVVSSLKALTEAFQRVEERPEWAWLGPYEVWSQTDQFLKTYFPENGGKGRDLKQEDEDAIQNAIYTLRKAVDEMRTSAIAAVVFASLASQVAATIYVTEPVASTVCDPSKAPCNVKWSDDGNQPPLASIGNCKIELCTGGQIQQTCLQILSAGIDVSQNAQIAYNANPQIGPAGTFYFIKFTSLTAKDPTNPAFPFTAYSAKFNVVGTGTFNSTVQAQISGAAAAPSASVAAPAAGAASTSAGGAAPTGTAAAGSGAAANKPTSTSAHASGASSTAKSTASSAALPMAMPGVASAVAGVTVAVGVASIYLGMLVLGL